MTAGRCGSRRARRTTRPTRPRRSRRRCWRPRTGCWAQCETAHSSATLARIFSAAGVTAHEEFIETYFGLWEPHTYTDPDVAPLLRLLRDRSIRVGVLSNTVWPRALHERVFRRDGVLELIDGAVYSSEIPWTKPHPEAFRAAMAAIGVTDPASCVFVGDRPFDDIYGAARLGMRTVFIPHSGLPPLRGLGPGRGHLPAGRAARAARPVVSASGQGHHW